MELYSWGANSHGQLGHNNQTDLCTAKRVAVPESRLHYFTHICGGGGHTSLVLDNGDLMTCGLNDQGQLGDSSHPLKYSLILRVIPGIMLQKVACGWDFTLAVSGSGQLLGWGSNVFGNLGEISACKKQPYPMLIKALKNETFLDIAAGLRHSVALSSSGDVWVWGDSRKGQIPEVHSHLTTERLCSPTKVTFPGRVIQLCCGSFFTLLLTDDGEIHGWGDNQKGQLTVDPVHNSIIRSVCKLTAPKCVQVSTGWSHVLAISDKKELFSWGRGDYGQLGRHCSTGMDHRASKVDILKEFRQVCCGSEHSLAVTNDNILYAWGWNEHGMCGKPESVATVPYPEAIHFGPNKKVCRVGAGSGYSFALVLT